VWYIFAPQCASTLVTVRRETNSRAWMWFLFGYMLVLAYGGAFITYQVACAFGAG
jgi:ferrous iron transport protein B